jgi:uncharacterized protein
LAFLREMLFGNRWLVDTMTARCPDFVVADTPAQLVQRMNALLGARLDAHGDPVCLASVELALQTFDDARSHKEGGGDAQWENIRLARRWRGDRLRTARPRPMLDPAAGPLIAILERIISRKSLGGIGTDLDGRVMDMAGRAIAGLYAAGEASGFGGGGMNGKRALEGTFLGGCIYSARRAARGIALDVTHDMAQ